MRHHQSLGDLLGDPVAEALDDVGLDAVAEVAEEGGRSAWSFIEGCTIVSVKK